MSDNFLILIPQDPNHVPTADQQSEAGRRMRGLAPNADEIKTETFETVQFFDCAANFSSVSCPHCRSEIPQDWWGDKMDADYEDGFQLASYDAPCCGKAANLHELVYDWPQGFGRFAVTAMNPGIGLLSDQQREEFEALLGTKLRVIYNHL